MTKLIVCDMCGEGFELDHPRVEMSVAEGFAPGLEEGTYDICSVECVRQFADSYGKGEAHEHEHNHVISEPTLPDIDVPETGVYFPDGMRVDGKDAANLPKPTVRRVVRSAD